MSYLNTDQEVPYRFFLSLALVWTKSANSYYYTCQDESIFPELYEYKQEKAKILSRNSALSSCKLSWISWHSLHFLSGHNTTPCALSFSAQVTSLNRSAFLIKNFSNKKSTLIKCPGGFSNAIEVEQFMPHFYSRRMYYLLGLLSQFVPSETFGSVFHRLSQLHPISFSFHSWEGQWSPVMPWL